VAAEFWRLGYAVICPHLNSALMDGVVPDETFLAGDREFICRMRSGDVLVLLPGWTESAGTMAELAIAVVLGLTIAEWSAAEHRARLFARTTVVLKAAL
jgi:hypothetical protein